MSHLFPFGFSCTAAEGRIRRISAFKIAGTPARILGNEANLSSVSSKAGQSTNTRFVLSLSCFFLNPPPSVALRLIIRRLGECLVVASRQNVSHRSKTLSESHTSCVCIGQYVLEDMHVILVFTDDTSKTSSYDMSSRCYQPKVANCTE